MSGTSSNTSVTLKRSQDIKVSSSESFPIAFLIDSYLLLVQTLQDRRFSVVAPNYANIILKVRIFKLLT